MARSWCQRNGEQGTVYWMHTGPRLHAPSWLWTWHKFKLSRWWFEWEMAPTGSGSWTFSLGTLFKSHLILGFLSAEEMGPAHTPLLPLPDLPWHRRMTPLPGYPAKSHHPLKITWLHARTDIKNNLDCVLFVYISVLMVVLTLEFYSIGWKWNECALHVYLTKVAV